VNVGTQFYKLRNLEIPSYNHSSWEDFYSVAYITPLVFLGQTLTHHLLKGWFRSKFEDKYSNKALKLKIQ